MKNETKTLIKQIALPVGIFLGLCLAAILGIYFALFKPNFMRGNGKPVSIDTNHFLTKENEDKNKADTEWFFAQAYEEISVTSFDGLKLVAYNFPAENAKGTWLLIHGHQSAPLREYAGLARFFHELGYNVVLPYQRAHGKSEGTYITFGIKERYDVRDWILKINEIYGDTSPLYLEGISMGCTTVLMSLSFDLPANLQAVVADCKFLCNTQEVTVAGDYAVKGSAVYITLSNDNVDNYASLTGCTFSDNVGKGPKAQGSMVALPNGRTVIDNCNFYTNSFTQTDSARDTSGAYLYFGINTTMRNCRVSCEGF